MFAFAINDEETGINWQKSARFIPYPQYPANIRRLFRALLSAGVDELDPQTADKVCELIVCRKKAELSSSLENALKGEVEFLSSSRDNFLAGMTMLGELLNITQNNQHLFFGSTKIDLENQFGASFQEYLDAYQLLIEFVHKYEDKLPKHTDSSPILPKEILGFEFPNDMVSYCEKSFAVHFAKYSDFPDTMFPFGNPYRDLEKNQFKHMLL